MYRLHKRPFPAISPQRKVERPTSQLRTASAAGARRFQSKEIDDMNHRLVNERRKTDMLEIQLRDYTHLQNNVMVIQTPS